MSLLKIWQGLVSTLVELNESIVFNSRLIKWYRQNNIHPKVVIDVGSNRGQSIKIFKKLNKKCIIHCFEPNASLCDKLRTRYSHEASVKVHNMGVSSFTGKTRFNETVINQTSTIEDLNYDSKYLKMKSLILGIKPTSMIKKSYEIKVTTLRDFITSSKLQKIDLIKIDTEGHEFECLKGLFDSGDLQVDYIQVETHDDDMYKDKYKPDDLEALMHDNSFTLVKKIPHGFGEFNDYIYKHSRPKN